MNDARPMIPPATDGRPPSIDPSEGPGDGPAKVPARGELPTEATLGRVLLDQAAGSTPVFTLVGIAIGMVGGGVGFWVRVRSALRDPGSS